MAPTLEIHIERAQDDVQPAHHVLSTTSPAGWTTFFSGVPDRRRQRGWRRKPARDETFGFRNPWPSFHKATRQEMWQSLEWGEDTDPAIDLAASHPRAAGASLSGSSSSSSSSSSARAQQAAQLLQITETDFSFSPDTGSAKTTWLGHASMLLQLPALKQGGDHIRIIFDPIFSERSSPSQYVGPIRSYRPPCKLQDLPPIDLLLISHNHYDHLDYDTVMTLWRLNQDRMRFIVPLKNSRWFVDSGIPADRVVELDWWESVDLTEQSPGAGTLKVSCTPAQHSSLRDGYDADSALWSGWYLRHVMPRRRPYRVFFAGDSGYQCHADPTWPPKPPKGTTHKTLEEGAVQKVADPDPMSSEKYPPCPAYREIATRFGTPDLVYLPVALGATWAYFRSFFSNYIPPANVPFPRHSAGVTGAIHMPPWDAVRVLRDLTSGAAEENEDRRPPIAIAMHWGTFVTEPVEVLKSLGHLEWACYNQGIRFGRGLADTDGAQIGQPVFLALNHGQSIIS